MGKTGTIKRARRVNGRDDLRQFTVVPFSNLDVVIIVPADRPCEDDGAICTSSNKRLSKSLELTVSGPVPVNAPAAGSPTTSGQPAWVRCLQWTRPAYRTRTG